jgi:hypothetical protein
MRIRKLAAALIFPLLAACSGDFISSSRDELVVSGAAGGITLTNRSGQPLYYTAFELETASRSLWGACDDPRRCEHVSPSRSVTLQHSDFSGYEPGDETGIVYYWHLRPKLSGGYEVAGELESVRVPL